MLTNKEALLGVINYPLPGFDFAVRKALEDAGLVAEHIYTPDSTEIVDLCAAKLILFILTAPASISNNGLALSTSKRNELTEIRSLILAKYGIVDDMKPESSITDGSDLW